MKMNDMNVNAQVAGLKAEKHQNEEILRNLKELQAADAARLAELQRQGHGVERVQSKTPRP